ncbi:elongin-B [Puma concolor]|uniref:Elongin-B n=1 Tax=Puma concolor TaxID=9696 RepID=A0A6P6H9W6_PUMCO|nr:elongin-B [Puma concolor]
MRGSWDGSRVPGAPGSFPHLAGIFVALDVAGTQVPGQHYVLRSGHTGAHVDDQLLDDGKTLGECGFTSQTARPQAPATVGLAFRADDAFEALRIEPFSSPPELPDVMKPQDSGSSANEQAVQ